MFKYTWTIDYEKQCKYAESTVSVNRQSYYANMGKQCNERV